MITNLSGDNLTHEEETILRFGGLKYDLATRPKRISNYHYCCIVMASTQKRKSNTGQFY